MSESKWWCFAVEVDQNQLESEHTLYCNADKEQNESIRGAFIERGYRVSEVKKMEFKILTVH